MGVRVEKAKKDEMLDKSQQLQDEISSKETDLSDKVNRQANIYIIKADVMEISLERIALYQKAFDLLKNFPEKTFENQMTFARSIQRIGSNYIWLGNQTITAGDKVLALNYYKQAFPYQQKYLEIVTGNVEDAGTAIAERRIAMGYQHLGEAYIKLGDFKLGFENLEKSLLHYQTYMNKNSDNFEAEIDISNCYFAFANAYEESNDLHRSIEFNQKGLVILNKVIEVDANTESIKRKIARMYKLVGLFDKTNQSKQSHDLQKQLVAICSIEANKQFCKN